MRAEGSDEAMETHLSQNIRKSRLAAGMTQEQLAEAMDVTVGAVYKWETGRSVPDIRLIMDLADLFELSVDALVGYQTRPGDRAHVVERLRGFIHSHHPADGLDDARKALQKYPNDFRVVQTCAKLYLVHGFQKSDEASLRLSLKLLERACLLINQNTDPDISVLSLRILMSKVHLALEEYDQAIALLTQNNPCHVNDALIGLTLCWSGRKEESRPYLSQALVNLLTQQSQIVDTYVNLDDPEGGLVMVDWLLAGNRILQKPGQRSHLHREEAIYEAVRAGLLLSLGRRDEAIACLRRARKVARWFDEAPCYQANAIRFVHLEDPISFYDGLGESAIEALQRHVALQESAEFSKLWEEISHEEEP